MSGTFSPQGRTALVTGASRGIGAAIARTLDTTGARVAPGVLDTSDAARFITGETISADGGMARTLDLYSGDV